MKCNFPLKCGRNKEVCCHYCNLECNYKCPIDKSECEDFEEKKIMIIKNKNNIREIAMEIADLVEKKNHDYNNSFDKTINEYGDVAYFLRLEDKLNRLKNLTKKEAKVKDEAIEDTLKDIVGYTLLMLNYKKGRE